MDIEPTPENRDPHTQERPKDTPKTPSEQPHDSGHDDPCCCDHITLYLTDVTVDNETDAPIPLIGIPLGFFTDDRVAVKCKSCDGTVAIWPHDAPGQKIPKGKTVKVDAPLATVKPSSKCWVSCHIQIQVYRASRVNEILDALNKLLPELAKAAADYVTAQNTAGLAAGVVAALGARVDQLTSEVSALEKALLGANDALMGEFFVNFEGSLACTDAKLKKAVEKPDDAREITDDEVAIDRTLENFGGKWTVNLRAVKSCPNRKK